MSAFSVHGARCRLGVTLLAVAVALPALLWASSDKQDDLARLSAATTLFRQVMTSTGAAIPAEVIKGAKCIAIIPGEKKGAFGVGVNYGKGLVTCRQPNGAWGPPLFITIGGGSWGIQIGVQSEDVIMIFGSQNQLDSLLSDKFRVGAEAAAAAGPVGRHIAGDTDVKLNSEILTYGRSKGAFAGISISGAVVQPDSTGNAAMYGPDLSTEAILDGHHATPPPQARTLYRELDRAAAQAHTGNGTSKGSAKGTGSGGGHAR